MTRNVGDLRKNHRAHGGKDLLVLTAFAVLSLALTYPLVFHLTTAVPNDIGDPLLNTWILAWDSHALLADPLDLFDANIFYPLPNALAYSEHLISTALLALPIQYLSGEPVLAYNLSLLVAFPLAAFGMYLLALHWTGQRSAAFIAGLIFGFAPYRFAAIAHLQLLTFQWLPFAILLIDKLAFSDRPPTADNHARSTRLRKRQLALTPFLTFQLLASWYLALYTLLIIAVYLAVGLAVQRASPARPLARLLPSFALTALLVLPFALPYLPLLNELRQARPLDQAVALAAAPTDFAAAAPFSAIFGPLTESLRDRPHFTEENTLFLGFIAPLLALIGSVSALAQASSSSKTDMHRSVIFALLVTLAISLLLTFALPYAALAALIPPTTIVRVPPRWVIPALFALAGLAAFGYGTISQRLASTKAVDAPSGRRPSPRRAQANSKGILAGLIVTLLLLESLSIPLPLARVENRATLNPVYHWLAAQPADFALIELPLHSAPAPEFPEVKRMYASTLGWWPLVNGYSGYTPPRQPRLAETLDAFPDDASAATLQALADEFSLTSLYLLIHPGEAPLDRSQWETVDRWRAERNPALRPLGQFNGDYLYHVLPPDPQRFDAPPLAVFGPDKSLRLLAVAVNSSRSPNAPPALTLFWQATASILDDYTVFIHLRAADGFVRSQADGPPVTGHYPTSGWQPGEIIQDIHPLPADDFDQVDHLAVGLYNPHTGARIPAFSPGGQHLVDDALTIPFQQR